MRGRSAVNWRQVLASDGNGAKIASPPGPVHLHYGPRARATTSGMESLVSRWFQARFSYAFQSCWTKTLTA